MCFPETNKKGTIEYLSWLYNQFNVIKLMYLYNKATN